MAGAVPVRVDLEGAAEGVDRLLVASGQPGQLAGDHMVERVARAGGQRDAREVTGTADHLRRVGRHVVAQTSWGHPGRRGVVVLVVLLVFLVVFLALALVLVLVLVL